MQSMSTHNVTVETLHISTEELAKFTCPCKILKSDPKKKTLCVHLQKSWWHEFYGSKYHDLGACNCVFNLHGHSNVCRI